MQPVFDYFTPVVDFGATPRPLRWGQRRWVLWPAHAFKVLLPATRSAAFNLFQRAMLDLCRAGVKTPSEIGKRIALPEDLVTFVLEQLRGMEMLDGRSAPTARALRLLVEEDSPTEAEDAGYVFVDGHSHRLWPRIHRGSLPFVNADVDPGKPAKFQRGSQGNPETVIANVLWPANLGRSEITPTSLEILKAARHHRRRLRAFARESSGEDARGDFALGALKRVRLVGSVPEPILVATCVFLPSDARHQAWLVTDPCGLGVSDVLRDSIARLANDGKLKVRELLEQLTGKAWQIDDGDVAHYFAEANRVLNARVVAQLGSAASLLPPDVVNRLADADERLERARSLTSASTKLIEDFLGNAYAALEGVFGWVLSLYPDPTVLAAMAVNASDNGQLLQKLAMSLGYSTSDRTIALLSISRSVVKGALCDGNRTLPGRLAAGLLAANANPGHPLNSLAARDADALEFLAYLGKLRIAASHDTSSIPTVDVAFAVRDRILNLLRALVGDGSLDVGVTETVDLSWGTELFLRMRAQAGQALHAYDGIDEYPDLRTRLLDMHYAAMLVKSLAQSGTASSDAIKTRLRDFAVNVSIAMEAGIAEIEKVAPSLQVAVETICDDRAANAKHIASAASIVGFQLDTDGSLPESLSHAQPDRIRRAARGQSATLSAKLVAQLLSAAQQPEHPLREVARNSPVFLLHVGRIVDARGHGDEVTIKAEDAAAIEVMVREDLRTVLAALA